MALIPGKTMLFKLCCPGCGSALPDLQPEISDFFFIRCDKTDCPAYGSEALVERRTGIILSVNVHEFTGWDGKRYRIHYEEINDSKTNK